MAGHRIQFTCPHCGKKAVYAPWELLPEEQFKSISIEQLDLPTRTLHALWHAGIKTVRDLYWRTPDDLLRVTDFGPRSLDEVRKVLQKMNLSLNEPPPQ